MKYTYEMERLSLAKKQEGIYGVGFIGKGKYKVNEDGKHTKQFNAWYGMLMRCYSENFHKKSPSYVGCTVCDEWLSFQVFAKWYDENFYLIEGQKMHLDKDILVKGNKHYSPETCVFVPNKINSLFTKSNAIRGDLPIGVHLNKKNNRFRAGININGEKIKIGEYDTKEEAFQWYKDIKESVIKVVANEHKNKIPKKLYDAMYSYEVEFTD